jgi:Fe-Mn family superoxide dismutase
MTGTIAQSFPAYEVRNDIKPAGLDGLSDKLIEQHWALYKGYVANVNAINKSLTQLTEAGVPLNDPKAAELQRRLGFEYNGMVLHEYYFEALKAGGQERSRVSPVFDKISDDFGGFNQWRKQFTEIGKMRGVGWAICALDPASKRLVNLWVEDHEVGNVAGFIPVVVMDVWEHAFVSDYGTSPEGRGNYIEAYFRNLDWDLLSARLEAATQSASTRAAAPAR